MKTELLFILWCNVAQLYFCLCFLFFLLFQTFDLDLVCFVISFCKNLFKAFEFANEQIRQFRNTSLNGAKTGATVAIVLIQENTAFCAWSGDCRIRYYKNQQLAFESKDHTLANDWLRQGLNADFSVSEKYQRVVTKAICGAMDNWQPSVEVLREVRIGERFLLLTDGGVEIVNEDNRSMVSCKV